jgi:hypothetical protein
MSHISKLSSVPITDISALRSAVADLQAQGIKCKLVEGKGPRLYYDEQVEAYAKVPYTLQLQDARFDIGFEAEYDDKGILKQYSMITDFYQDSVSKQLGYNNPQPGEDLNTLQLGKLYQAYAKHAALNSAYADGYDAVAVTDSKGLVHLTITGDF